MNLKSKKAKALLSMCNLQGLGLEIGGNINPLLPKTKGFNVETLDVADKETLRGSWERGGVKSSENYIQEVDYILNQTGSYVDTIGKTSCYDFIVANCVIEHTVCIISFIHDCMELLRQNGILALAIPDKRYVFDFHRPLSSVAEAIDCYKADNKYRHSPGMLGEYYLNYTTMSNHEQTLLYEPSKVKEILDNYEKTNVYHDIHHWVFTRTSFELLILDLISLGYLENLRVVNTNAQGVEFFVNIQKTDGSSLEYSKEKRLQLLKQIENELRGLEEDSANAELIDFCTGTEPKHLYVYGTGCSGNKAALALESLGIEHSGFIVSDYRYKHNTFMGHPVRYLSEADFTENKTGVIIALNTSATENVIPDLENRGVKNYLEF